MKIIGYPAELIRRPGDRAGFMVSTDGIAAFDAELVRIHCGDSRENGPGFKETAVESCRRTAVPGRKQETEIGSCMIVQPGPRIPDDEIGFVLNVFATTPTKVRQTLLARWDEASKLGFRLGIDATSTVEAEIGDGSGAVFRLALPCPIAARQWTTIGFGLSGESGRVVLQMKSA